MSISPMPLSRPNPLGPGPGIQPSGAAGPMIRRFDSRDYENWDDGIWEIDGSGLYHLG